ncbi:MAG: prepilin-type N-terminal cleavage/methylation domain-containing protein [Candidatus Omnitrophica bacterium]|nr:prepilin-type N-terminal cleavage/methylation domain-containing protein [Candidatus Omnitrophota bacterium]
MSKQAFTMTELIVVMVIISIIAAFGVPSFNKTMTRARARDAINNLTIISAAQALRNANFGSYFTADRLSGADPAINTGLSLQLLSNNDIPYTCAQILTPNLCIATLPSNTQIMVNLTLPIVKTGSILCAATGPVVGGSNPCCLNADPILAQRDCP